MGGKLNTAGNLQVTDKEHRCVCERESVSQLVHQMVGVELSLQRPSSQKFSEIATGA